MTFVQLQWALLESVVSDDVQYSQRKSGSAAAELAGIG